MKKTLDEARQRCYTCKAVFVNDISERRLTLSAELNMERYRSGHNEAVLKTVCPQGRVGSNPTLSASFFFVRD